MRNDIQPALQTIQEYFSKKEFYIPSYQRPYSWRVDRCEELIENIQKHYENFDKDHPDHYFFGTILIAQEYGEEHEVALIDGQQRTTTFMLLLKAMLLKLKAELGKLSPDSREDAQLFEKLTSLTSAITSMLYNLSEDEAFFYKRGEYKLAPKNIKYVNDSISEMHQEDLFTILLAENFTEVEKGVKQFFKKKLDNRYTNFYKNFRYFNSLCQEMTNTEIRDFVAHFLFNCQLITITSFNTDQAISIFNSLNGTSLPLEPIEVIVAKATAGAAERKVFEQNWRTLVESLERSPLDLNTLVTHYIFTKLSEKRDSNPRNPGTRAFFKKYDDLLKNDVQFTEDLERLRVINQNFYQTSLGQIFSKFDSKFRPFVSSYLFFREDESYLNELLKLAVLLKLTDYVYSHAFFKGFLERINMRYSLVDTVTTEDLKAEFKHHIASHFDPVAIKQTILTNWLKDSLVYLNEYLYAKEGEWDFKIVEHTDIEHIMPKSGLNREHILKEAGFTDGDEFNNYAERLGNKILLEADINRGIADAWFKTKKENSVTSRGGYRDSSYRLPTRIVSYPSDTWGKEDIEKMTEKAADRIINFIFGE